MATRQRFGIGLLVLIAVLVAYFLIRYPGRPATTLPASACDATLWPRTYENQRLAIIAPCTAVEGRVVSVHRNADGDAHIGLEPDDKRVLNFINATHAKRILIAEVVCDHPPKEPGPDSNTPEEYATVKAACAGYTSAITLPQRGDRVRITGAYVTDRDNGWREIHPVSKIDILH